VRAGWGAVLAATDTDNPILRTTVTRGVSGRGLWPRAPSTPTVIVSAIPWNAELCGQPARLVTSAILRNPSSPASRLKTLSYLDNVLAARAAAERECDDALFLNPAGRIASTTIANVFAVHGNRIATPQARDGAMPGVMRRIVLEGARRLGFDAAEGAIEPADLRTADAVFITNSVRFLRPVVSLDGHPISTAGAPILVAIANAVAGEVRRECGFDLPALPLPFGPEIASAKVEGPEAGRAGAAS
jgi:branched-chain amino acid aminotransferase